MKRADLYTGVLCLAAFTAVVNIVLLIPILTDVANAFDISEASVGQLATLHALVAAAVALLAAPLTDRYPRRLVLRVECAILLLGTLVSAAAPTFLWMATGRALAGVGAALIIPTCLAMVSDMYPDEAVRNRRLGLLGSSAALSTVIGLPILTQTAALTNWRWSIAIVGVLVIIVGVCTWLLPAQPCQLPAAGVARLALRSDYKQRYGAVLSERGTLYLFGIQFVLSAVIIGLWLYFAAWAEIDLLASAGVLSALFLISGLCELATSNITPRLLELVTARRAFIAEAGVLSASLLGVGALFTRTWTLFPFVVLVSLTGLGLLFINVVLLIDAQRAAPGTALSLNSVCGELGAAGGALLGGLALATFDSYTALYRTLGLFLLLAIALIMLMPRRAEEKGVLADLPALPAPAVAYVPVES